MDFAQSHWDLSATLWVRCVILAIPIAFTYTSWTTPWLPIPDPLGSTSQSGSAFSALTAYHSGTGRREEEPEGPLVWAEGWESHWQHHKSLETGLAAHFDEDTWEVVGTVVHEGTLESSRPVLKSCLLMSTVWRMGKNKNNLLSIFYYQAWALNMLSSHLILTVILLSWVSFYRRRNWVVEKVRNMSQVKLLAFLSGRAVSHTQSDLRMKSSHSSH